MTEGERARAWREGFGLSRPKLAAMTGYSVSAIRNFEAGANRGNGAPIPPKSMLAYKLACAAVASGLTFDWGPVSINLE